MVNPSNEFINFKKEKSTTETIFKNKVHNPKKEKVDYVADSWNVEAPFLTGNHAPVFEERYITDLVVMGELPKWLNGVYMRNGPNPHFHSEDYSYPYDGDGMIHAIYFENSGVKYRNRWVKTEELEAEKRANKSLWNSLTKPQFPSRNDVKQFNVPFTPVKNTANTSIIQHAGNLLALYEGGPPYKITEDLETIGQFTFDDNIKGMMPHPKTDPLTGELHFLQYSVVQFPFIRYYVINKRGHVTRDLPIYTKSPTVLHDMILTPNYVLFFLCPLQLSFMKIMLSKNPIQWKPQQGTKIGIIPRYGSSKKVIWHKTEPFFVWHTMNGFEENGNILIDYIRHEQGVHHKDNSPPQLYRLTLNTEKGILSNQKTDDQFVEFPSINNRKTGQKYRFGYAARRDMKQHNELIEGYFTELIQYDFERQTHLLHRLPKGQYAGEPTFVPHPYKEDETEGVIVAFVYDANTDMSKLIIIEPLNFDKTPLAIIELPFRVPNGFHGNWIGF